jgi:hypothetical protein
MLIFSYMSNITVGASPVAKGTNKQDSEKNLLMAAFPGACI